MKNIYLILFTVLFIFSCSDPMDNESDPLENESNPMKNEFVSACVAETPGGSSFVAICECAWEGAVSSLSSDEEEAMRRDYNEMGDEVHAISFAVKSVEAAQNCVQ